MTKAIDIGAKSETQVHWERYSPVNEKLREAVEPIAEQLASEVEILLQNTKPEEREELLEDTANAYTLPYGRIGMLPPALFGEISKGSIRLDRQLKVPDNDDEIEAMAKAYEQWGWQQANSGNFSRYAFPGSKFLESKMKELKGVQYPYQDWQLAARAMRRALKEEPFFAMDIHQSHRIVNSALDYDQLNARAKAEHRPYKNYTLALSRISPEDELIGGFRENIHLPIGEYGEEASAKLARATLLLNDFLETSPIITESVREQVESDSVKELLVTHTARSKDRFSLAIDEYAVHGLKATLSEGILTTAQVLSFLTAEKVEGFEDHDELVAAILDSNIIEQFTRVLQPGYIGPATLSGLYRPGSIEVGEDKKIRLSRQLTRDLGKGRRLSTEANIKGWREYEDGKAANYPSMLGLPCPATAPNGAISSVRSAFKNFYKA